MFDLAVKEQRVVQLETVAGEPSFWDDSRQAQRVMREIDRLRGEISLWRGIERRLADLAELLELAVGEGDETILSEIISETDEIATDLERRHLELMLSGELDDRSAILAIHAGAGGTESQDWAEMLMRMYLRWAERRGFKSELLDLSPGEEAGIKSVTIQIDGPYAYGYLKAERGVHRLVRLSPFDAAHRRHTSFALAEVMPEVPDDVEVTINPDDLHLEVFRSSGAGGQNVQKNATAVRIRHIPTGTVVTCQNERSQLQNRETAMRILRARLLEMEVEKREQEQARIKGQHVSAEWGNQIRSYVLHPYNLVKDHRTEYETSNTTAVLDGEIDAFIERYLKSRVGEAAA
ncbi:MAG: peptide chain release factor 2 [Chloroflexi bacterium]|nr:peptide chain release factor 2 [Chloroflexota bacterium]